MPELQDTARPTTRRQSRWTEFETLLGRGATRAKEYLARLTTEESIVQLEDLLLRRTDWETDPADAQRRSRLIEPVLVPSLVELEGPAMASEVEPASAPTWPEST